MKRKKLSLEELQILENALAQKHASLGPNFSVRVMEKIEEEKSSLFYKLKEVVVMSSTVLNSRRLVAVAGVCTLVFCFAYVVRDSDKIPFAGEANHFSSGVGNTQSTTSDKREVLPLEEGEADPAESLSPELPLIRQQIEENAAKSKSESLVREKRLNMGDMQAMQPAAQSRPLAQAQSYARADRLMAGSVYVAPDYYPVPYPEANTETYGQYEENPRILVSTEPRSTFSIDVDTASYTNARRFISMGQMPPSDSIRIEEFINYFDYNYPSQSEKPFGVHYEIAPSPFSEGRHLLKIGIKAKDVARDASQAWNLAFLIDVSGSMMDQNKLPLLQRSLKLLVDKMRAEDKLAIVTYAGGAGVALELTSGSEKAKINAVIDSLTAGGSTYGSAGINEAYSLLSKHFDKEKMNRVILASDGDFNVGVTSFQDLVKLIEEKRKTGIFLTTLGFGSGNLNDQNMEQLANKGNGSYYYIDSFREARKVLETGLTSNMHVVAKDVKLQIEFNPANVLEYRLVGYDNRKLRNQDFANDKIDAGEIGAGHTVTAIYELVLADSKLAKDLKGELRYEANKEKVSVDAATNTSELAFLQIRYKAPTSDKSTPLSYPIEKEEIKGDFESASADYKFAVAVTSFAEILRGGSNASDFDLDKTLKIAEGNKGSDTLGYRQEFIELVKDAKAMKAGSGSVRDGDWESE